MKEGEKWLDIPGFPDYQASSLGRLKSFKRTNAGRISKSHPTSDGYLTATLRIADNIPITVRVHRLIAAAFLGPIPDGLEVNHKNGIRDDNRVENLEICTRSHNMIHRRDTLGYKGNLGEKHGMCRLTKQIVLSIRDASAKGASRVSLSAKYGVTPENIGRIVYRKTWKHLP